MIRFSLIGAMLYLPTVLFAQTDDVVWAEVSISDVNPYVQQTVIYTVTIKSAEALDKVVEPELINIRGVTPPKKIDETKSPYRVEFRYTLTPLTLGQVKIPATSLEVTYNMSPSQWGYQPYYNRQLQKYSTKIQTKELTLNVRPPVTSQQLWLPLTELKLQGQVDRTRVENVGEPITVTLTLNAVGMGGEQLPALVLPMDEKNFHVYAERPQTSQSISRDKTTVIGQRIEKYTLVPQEQGRLEIPMVRLFWWDIKKNRESMVEWLGSVIEIGDVMPIAPTAPTEKIEPSKAETNNLLFKISMIGIILFIIGWWLGAGRPGKSQIKYLLDTLLIAARRQTQRLWMNLMSGLRQLLQTRQKPLLTEMGDSPKSLTKQPPKTPRTPKSIRIFNLIHAIDTENNPVIFLQYVQQLAHEFLHLPPFAPLPQIADTLLTTYPYLNATRVYQLFQTLDDALYSGTYTFNPEAWKADFRSLFRTLPFHSAQMPSQEKEKQGLPPLNPLLS